jgi:hypothetical protein
MKMRAWLLVLTCAAGAFAAPASAPTYTTLPPGRYSIALQGLICTMCAKAVAAQWSKFPEFEKVEVNFASASAVVTVRLNASVAVSDLTKALKRAEKVANLGARFSLGEIRYLR